MKSLIRWLIKTFLKDYHLAKNPPKGMKREKKKGGENDGDITSIK